jgi:hypothetical protein
LYLLLFCFLITRISFFVKSNINKKILVAIFIIKVAAGFAYAFFYQLPAYRINSDTFRFFAYSTKETDLLLRNPLGFLKDLFSYSYQSSGNIFSGENSYWNDLKSNVIIKLMAVFNVFSFTNYYINIVFFNFLFLFGLIGFYRLMQLYSTTNKWLLIGSIFLIPSFLFWCSGVHKDGLIFSAAGLAFWYFNLCLSKTFTLLRVLILAGLFMLIFSLRNYVCFALLLSFFGWYFATKSNKKTAFIYVYAFCIVLFFVSPFLHPKLNFPKYITLKQQEFKKLNGGSAVVVQDLEPQFSSFIKYFPNAVDMAFLRPHISEIKNKSYIPAILENLIILIIPVICFAFKKENFQLNNFSLACLCFAFSILLITGYTITFSGAVVRYKSLILPFLIAPFLSLLDINKIRIALFNKTN